VTAQLGRVQHTSNLYYTEPCARLAQMLCTRTGMRRVFFSNSGAEANECAIKAARKWAAENKGPEYSTIVTLRNSFHGRTLTTLAATGQDHYHELFQPLTPGFVHVAAGDAGELAAAFSRYKVAGVLIECIQGEGGVLPLDPEYARALARIVQENDAVLMVDEVQTGNGRTGRLYGYMHYGLEPDVVSTAKGLGGGLPLGATLLGERLQNVFGFGDHGSTFGGNPVCCAGAISILERIDDALLESVRSKGEFVRTALAGAPGIESVAGMGLMLGVKTVRPASEVVAECMRRGVLCLTAKDKVRLLPALNITMDLLEKAVAVIREAARP
jgi:acetylornithine/N-succinyldiaminopimelate aminotransferase